MTHRTKEILSMVISIIIAVAVVIGIAISIAINPMNFCYIILGILALSFLAFWGIIIFCIIYGIFVSIFKL